MPTEDDDMPADRRTFMKTLGAASLALGAPTVASAMSPGGSQKSATPVRFGIDMYSLGQQNLMAFQQMDFALKWNVKVVHFSEIRFLGSLEPDNLKKITPQARNIADVEASIKWTQAFLATL